MEEAWDRCRSYSVCHVSRWAQLLIKSSRNTSRVESVCLAPFATETFKRVWMILLKDRATWAYTEAFSSR